jgi:hypothetical protein
MLGIGLILGLSVALFLLGFRLGGDHWQQELARVQLEAAQAERRLHDLTRQAFVAMAQAAERRRSS